MVNKNKCVIGLNQEFQKPDRETARTRANRVNVPRPKKNQPARPNEEIIATSSKNPAAKTHSNPHKEILRKPSQKSGGNLSRKKAETETKPKIPKFSQSEKTVYKGKAPPRIDPNDFIQDGKVFMTEDQFRYVTDKIIMI